MASKKEEIVIMVPEREKAARVLSLRRHEWAKIAHYIVMMESDGASLTTDDELCRVFSLTPVECAMLRQVKEFRQIVEDIRSRTEESGKNASVKLRAQSMASHVLEKLYEEAISIDSEPGVRLRAAEMIFRYAGLDPLTDKKVAAQSVAGVQVVVSVPAGVPLGGVTVDADQT